MSSRHGPPKHQNQYAWKPKAGVKINETEVGGRFRPFSEVTGVCLRCKEQIEWKRKYGKYKQLTEPAKCQRCTKRNVRQAYHNLCTACAKEQKVCAKCSCRVERIIGRDITEVEAEQKKLEEAINNARERERRTLLRAKDIHAPAELFQVIKNIPIRIHHKHIIKKCLGSKISKRNDSMEHLTFTELEALESIFEK